MAEAATGGQGVVAPELSGSVPPEGPGTAAAGGTGRWSGRSWRAIFFAPVGDGQTRRRGSDATRLGLAVLVVILCWLTTRVNSSSEHTIASVLSSAPNGILSLIHIFLGIRRRTT